MSVDAAQDQLDQARTAMELALRTGKPARVETWLDACPTLASDADLAIELIYSEYVAREELGAAPAAEEYYSRFPQYRERLRRLFNVDELLKPNGAASSIAGRQASTNFDAVPKPAAVPRRVGQFELLEKLGGGGMGVVYRARQSRPSREVALKLLRSGADAAVEELARFHREAEAAARLHHPNIATIYEVGTDDGQPYIAMEYVGGGDLRSRLAGRPLPPSLAASLVVALGRAVHYAHSLGIVHRDLKPANLLVGRGHLPQSDDSAGGSPLDNEFSTSAKITDFGLAALLDDSARGLTRSGQLLGTLAYMAPEQASGTVQPEHMPLVDVYSLGAILYECLTGRPPFAADADATLLNLVLHGEPVSPSRLNPSIPRDLETIALKCLEKSPTRRYPTALALAEDIDRHLFNRPIQARPAGIVERASKWTRRHPVGASLIAATFVGLTVIGALTAGYTIRLTSTLLEVEQQRNRATKQEQATRDALAAESRRRTQARTALDQLTNQLIAGAQGDAIRPNEQRDQLQKTLAVYQSLAEDTTGDEASQVAVVTALQQAARILYVSGNGGDALDRLNTAIALAEKLAAANHAHRQLLSDVLFHRSRINHLIGRNADSVADGSRSVEIERSLPSRNNADGQYRRARTLLVSIVGARRAKMYDEAEAFEKEAIELFESLMEKSPDDPTYRNGLAGCYQNRAVEFDRRQDFAAAEPLYRRATAIRCPNGELPTEFEHRVAQADCYQATGRSNEKLGRPGIAADEYQKAVNAWDAVLNDRRNVRTYVNGFFNSLAGLERCINSASVQTTVDPHYRKMQRRIEKSAAEPLDPETVVLICERLLDYVKTVEATERPDDAFTVYESVARALFDVLERSPHLPRIRYLLMVGHAGAARAYWKQRRFNDAIVAWDIAIANQSTPFYPYAIERAKALASAGRIDEALAAEAAIPADVASILLDRSALFAIAARGNEAKRSEYESRSLDWLSKAKSAGLLAKSKYGDYVRSSDLWKDLRDREEFQKLLAE